MLACSLLRRVGSNRSDSTLNSDAFIAVRAWPFLLALLNRQHRPHARLDDNFRRRHQSPFVGDDGEEEPTASAARVQNMRKVMESLLGRLIVEFFITERRVICSYREGIAQSMVC